MFCFGFAKRNRIILGRAPLDPFIVNREVGRRLDLVLKPLIKRFKNHKRKSWSSDAVLAAEREELALARIGLRRKILHATRSPDRGENPTVFDGQSLGRRLPFL